MLPQKGRVGPIALLVLLVLVWAISWPVIKIGVGQVPPLWYGCLRYAIGALSLFALGGSRRSLPLPTRADWQLVAVSGLLQMAAYSGLTGFALTILPPGRASVLAFSTPIWVAPLAAWRLGERRSWRSSLGVAVGVAGVLAIAAPSLRVDGGRPLLAYGLLLGASAAWAVSIVYVRSHAFAASALDLAPWQMLLAALVLCLVAFAAEGPAPSVSRSGLASLAYVGPVATAFAYWAVVEVGRRVSARAISMGLLATPGVGILISAIVLGERVDLPLAVGLVLVATGIALSGGSR